MNLSYSAFGLVWFFSFSFSFSLFFEAGSYYVAFAASAPRAWDQRYVPPYQCVIRIPRKTSKGSYCSLFFFNYCYLFIMLFNYENKLQTEVALR